ncbi:hypothetical protein ACWEQU_02790, partial [Streptomyces nodosus]
MQPFERRRWPCRPGVAAVVPAEGAVRRHGNPVRPFGATPDGRPAALPSSVVQIMQRDAVDRLGLAALLLEPE